MILAGKVLGLADNAVPAVVDRGNRIAPRCISYIIHNVSNRNWIGGDRTLQAKLSAHNRNKRVPLRQPAQKIMAARVLDHNGRSCNRLLI